MRQETGTTHACHLTRHLGNLARALFRGGGGLGVTRSGHLGRLGPLGGGGQDKVILLILLPCVGHVGQVVQMGQEHQEDQAPPHLHPHTRNPEEQV